MQAIFNWFSNIGAEFAELWTDNPVAQIVGVLAMIVVFISFQQKFQKGIVAIQVVSYSLWTLYFFLLGAYTGCIMNGVAIFRNVIFAQRDKKKWASHMGWVYGIVGICIAVSILNVTVLTKPNERTVTKLLIEIFPILGTALTTIGLRMEKASTVRIYCLISMPLWLVYNVYSVALSAVVTDITTILSLVIAIARLDINKKKQQDDSISLS